MKLVTFHDPETNSGRLGVILQDKGILDLNRADASIPSSMRTFLEAGEVVWDKARAVEAAANAPTHAFDQTKLLAPLPNPPSVRDGYAFRQHVATSRRNRGLDMIPEFDEFPVFYFSNHVAVFGPGDVPVMERHLDRLDFELESAAVIGKPGRNLKASEADANIFGYMIFNDWSARALQMQEMKLNLGPAKGKDFASSFGPWLVTADELTPFRQESEHGARYDLKMTAFLNDKQLSEDSMVNMNWTFTQILERASYGVMLQPGDIIGSGTCGTGCLLELNGSKVVENLWVKDGDRVRLEIQGLGSLDNRIVKGS